MIFTDYRNVNLTNKSLRTVPVALYGHAEEIKSLTLSRNPMLDIPGDFVQQTISPNWVLLASCQTSRNSWLVTATSVGRIVRSPPQEN
jgi:hypothetical protein